MHVTYFSPNSAYCRTMSRRSRELISHSLRSAISVLGTPVSRMIAHVDNATYNIHGLINAPRPTMIPSTPVCSTFVQYCSAEYTSPPPKIGIVGTFPKQVSQPITQNTKRLTIVVLGTCSERIDALLDILPVRKLRIPLLSRPSVNLQIVS